MNYKPFFNFEVCIRYLESQGRDRFGAKFRIHESDHEVMYRLFTYFLRSQPDADQVGIDLSKGILLSGPVGCGKTTIMMLMNTVPGPGRNFAMRTCRDITFEFAEEGYDVISKYSSRSYKGLKARTYCFDDLGSEHAIKHFGNQCNVIGEILLSRYDHFRSGGMITHITTNLSATSIQEYYGDRIRSRLRETLNLIAFDPSTADKRR